MDFGSSNSSVIHFYQKVVDKTTLKRYTADFILRIFGLFYKKKHNYNSDLSDKMLRQIQAAIFTRFSENISDLEIDRDNIVEIKFEKGSSIPFVVYHSVKDSDILFEISFKKINWEEINEFRFFLTRYLRYYLEKFYGERYADEGALKARVEKVTYIVQELLQNANQYSLPGDDYKLIIRQLDGRLEVIVANSTERENAKKLLTIVKEIRESENSDELILKYMLSPEKSLGLITCIFNYEIESFKVEYVNSQYIKVDFIIPLFED